MNILIVEDDESFLPEYVAALSAVHGLSFTLSKSRDSALQSLSSGFFDLAVLDLKLPTADHALDLDISHGEAVFAEIQAASPGTPIIFLTASYVDPIYETILATKEKIDIWGDGGSVDTVQLKRKSQVGELIHALEEYSHRISAVDSIEVIQNGLDLGLTPEDRRILRVFARSRGGAGISLAPTDGGLSASRTLRVTIIDQMGQERLKGIVKLGYRDAVVDEERRTVHLQSLQAGRYAPFISSVKAATKGSAGILYRLADGYEQNLFSLLEKDEDKAVVAVTRLEESLRPWSQAANVEVTTIGRVRSAYIDDERAHRIALEYGIEIDAVEAKQIRARRSCCHGDLHGVNVLVTEEPETLLIDFGDAGDHFSAVDPVTLELSLFSHPAGQKVLKGWMPDFSAAWSDLSKYPDTTPFPQFIRATRQWAHRAGYGDSDVYANAYGYCLKQLKYPDTDKKFFREATLRMISYLA